MMGAYGCTHVIGAFAAGGAERFVVDLLRGLQDLGRRVDLLVLSSRRDEAGQAMAESLADAGIPFESGPTDRVRLQTIAWYARMMRARPDSIIHLHTTNTESIHFLASRVFGRDQRIVRTIHNTVLPTGGLAGFAFRNLPAEVSIGCGDVAAEQHAHVLPGEVRSIPNGVRFDWAIRSPEAAAESRNALGLDESIRHFVLVARMTGASLESAQKGHDRLIRAWRESGAGRGAHLHFVGDGELRPQLEALASGDESIRFEGIQKNVRQWLLAADGFIMPSRWEGLPIAAIEAIGTGLPCLFSDIPSLRELDGPNVSLIEAEDESALVRDLSSFVASSTFPETGRTESFRERYGIARAARQYDDVYQSLDRTR